VDEVPFDPVHDEPVDIIITEEDVIYCKDEGDNSSCNAYTISLPMLVSLNGVNGPYGWGQVDALEAVKAAIP